MAKRVYHGAYARLELWMRGELRRLMAIILVLLTGDPCAYMRWSVRGYYKKIYVEYGLALVGWPQGITFTNLSAITGFYNISLLLSLWNTGLMGFVPVEDLTREQRAARKPMDVVPSPQNMGVPRSLGRSDLKKHRGSRKVDPVKFPPRYVRNGPKSDKVITAEAEARAEQELDELLHAMEMRYQGEDARDPICAWDHKERAGLGA